jgi:hypothetical protein
MTTAAWCKEFGGKLVPADEASRAILSKIKTGDVVRVEVKRPRNTAHHRKFFALLNVVFENQEAYENPDHLLLALKYAVGHCDIVIAKDGSKMPIGRSIAFHKMNQAEFEAFYEKCLDVIAKHFLPGVETDALRAEVEGFLQ